MSKKDKIAITMNGEARELVMTFGLLNKLTTIVGSLQDISMIAVDPDVRTMVITTVLAERDERGRVIKEIAPDEIDINVDDFCLITEWVTEHVIDFFIRQIETSAKMIDKFKLKMETAQTSLPSGSQD